MPFTANVISAKEWGAKPPKQWSEITRPQYIVVHHTATPNSANDVSQGTVAGAKDFAKSIQTAHMDGFGWVATSFIAAYLTKIKQSRGSKNKSQSKPWSSFHKNGATSPHKPFYPYRKELLV